MGIGPHLSSSALSCREAPSSPVYVPPNVRPLGNPDPYNWRALNHEVVNGYLIVMAHYPDCNNYEGVKVMVFEKGVTLDDLKAQAGLDPHFADYSDLHHPIARFEPTKRGWDYAWKFALVARED